MGKMVEGLSSLFSAPKDTGAAAATQAASVANDRARQDAQAQAALTDQQAGMLAKTPRGRRLLVASAGDIGGLSDKIGG